MLKGIINHKNIYFFSLCLYAASLPLSIYTISVSTFILVVNWILEGNLKQKFRSFFCNPVVLVFTSLYLLHCIGLFYTTDFGYAFKDLRTKAPILLLPFIISTSDKIDIKKVRIILVVFISAVLIGTLICYYTYLTQPIIDIREISVFISHIRFSLLICFAFFILVYWIFQNEFISKLLIIVFLFISAWLLFFLYILESFTGVSVLILTSVFLLIRFVIINRNKRNILLILLFLSGASLFIYFYIRNIYNIVYCCKPEIAINYNQVTQQGNAYTHDTINKQTENGNFVMRYISENEMAEAWNMRSVFKFNQKNKKGQNIQYTIIRYLTSKGLYKDAAGVNALSDEDVKNIENGIANFELAKLKGVSARLFETIWEWKNYNETGNPNGLSLLMRIQFWKASLDIIQENLIIGVGTGDMNTAFAEQYDKSNSLLEKKWRLRSHNQFLSITVGFGVVGLIWFVIVLLYPMIKLKKWTSFYYITFFTIFFISILTEDTIETQAGVSIFAFFSSIFLFGCDLSERRRTEKNNL